MSPAEALLLAVAGAAAGAVNAAAGGGSLLSFPALLAVGLPPLAANVTNTVGLLPGYVGGVLAYRPELAGQGPRVRGLCATVMAGAVLGCALLLLGPEEAFETVAPLLVLTSCALLAAQPALTRRLSRRTGSVSERPLVLHGVVLLAGAYASYFGAAVGVLLLAVLALLVAEPLQRLNALKGALSLAATAVGATVFLVLAPVDLALAGVLAVSSLLGGRLGGRVARRLPDRLLRALVLGCGVVVAAALLR